MPYRRKERQFKNMKNVPEVTGYEAKSRHNNPNTSGCELKE